MSKNEGHEVKTHSRSRSYLEYNALCKELQKKVDNLNIEDAKNIISESEFYPIIYFTRNEFENTLRTSMAIPKRLVVIYDDDGSNVTVRNG